MKIYIQRSGWASTSTIDARKSDRRLAFNWFRTRNCIRFLRQTVFRIQVPISIHSYKILIISKYVDIFYFTYWNIVDGAELFHKIVLSASYKTRLPLLVIISFDCILVHVKVCHNIVFRLFNNMRLPVWSSFIRKGGSEAPNVWEFQTALFCFYLY